jgi:antitoxin component of MazEF toxin-antitoxin module
MPIVKKLVNHGNSKALVVDKALLDLLDIKDETAVEITTNGRSFTVAPVRSAEENNRIFEAALNETNEKYGGMLKKLAEN